ncbi:HD-GYP domain-containing protein [Haliovirga abyssi]|uniref:Phosphodiesterase n=1 Tax=Haliovirga abyssi TaxID=2996794 RepID=A0AAU9DJP2_9FUSO|nr:HD-GYP domain-containing protein [Haliovirga abyssi]BDU51089.1 phosphodiesterase [Haliovirga abyssi]
MNGKTKKISINDLKPGMKSGITLIDNRTGEVFLTKGIEVSENDIISLKKYMAENKGIELKTVNRADTIFSIDGKQKFLPSKSSKFVKQALSKKTQQEALKVVENLISDIRMGNVNSKEIKTAVEGIVDDILENEDSALNLLNIKDFDDYTYTHSVNVSTISILIAKEAELSKKDIIDIGIGGLLHDLGKTKIPLEVLNKSSKLTDEEFEIMKQHPVYTYLLLKDRKDISDIAKYIAAEHHEKFDGTGYPKKLKGEQINYFARIVAIADVYDALTTDRVYRKAMLPYDAMKIIVSGTGTHFDPDLVKVFLKTLSIYPTGSYVKLNTGEIAVVKKVNKNKVIRPDILIIEFEDGKKREPLEIDLSEDKTKFIVGAANINE